MENETEYPADITMDISGSQGAAFNGPFDSKSLQKTQRVEAGQKADFVQLRLFGDWELKCRFTYVIKDIEQEKAKAIQLEPSKTMNKHREEEIKQEQLLNENSEAFDSQLTR